MGAAKRIPAAPASNTADTRLQLWKTCFRVAVGVLGDGVLAAGASGLDCWQQHLNE